MPESDKILDAEQSIQNIALELKRMRDAANLLESSQAQMNAVLTSSRRVVQATEEFSTNCGIIVTKLASTDLNQILSAFEKRLGQIIFQSSEQATGIKVGLTQLSSTLNNLEHQLQNVAKESKSRQIATIVFVILTFLVSLFILIKEFLPSLFA